MKGMMAEQSNKKQRTIQVKIGNQAARAMTPDQAADYLKNIAGKGWGSGRELKMTFDNGSSSTVALPRSASAAGRDAELRTSTTTTAAAAAAAAAVATRSTSTRADGMPCSEKEMKALMSMFVEIMGLQMNTDRLNQVKTSARKKVSGGPRFSFPTDICPPPGGWPEDLLWPTVNDDDDDDNNTNESFESMPELEEIPLIDRPKHILYAQECAKKAIRHPKPITPIPPVPGSNETPEDWNAPVTGTEGISPYEWSALERAAIEDALEQEERFRKDSGRDKKSKDRSSMSVTSSTSKNNKFPDIKSPSTTAQEAALALQKVEAANKKLSKAVAMWRSRVVGAVTQNEIPKLEALLAESPLQTVTSLQQQAASVFTIKSDKFNNGSTATNTNAITSNPHLDLLIPMTVPKNAGCTKGSETRMMLAKYLLQEFSPSHFFTSGRNGRSAVHTACLSADHAVLKLIFEKARKKWTADTLCEALMEPCQDSGWTPLHHAVSSGSMRTVETLFKACGDKHWVQKMVLTLTNDMTTWKRGTNKGVTAQCLAEALVSLKPEKKIETHGMALHEILAYYNKLESSNSASASDNEPYWYIPRLTAISKRLLQIETMGYSPLNEKEMIRAERELAKQLERQVVVQQQHSAAASVTSTVSEKVSPSHEIAAVLDSDDEDESSLLTTNEKKRGKRSKKKKKSGGDVSVATSKDYNGKTSVENSERDMASVSVSEVSKPSACPDDPLVTALLGMGFELGAIMEGIKACGGLSRATADDVVACIFGAGGPTAPEVEAAPMDLSPLALEPPSLPETPSIDTPPYRNVDVARQKEDERIAAEKLIAKREEQRRRNREWNNRAQARQLQEAQEKVTKVAQSKTRVPNGPPLRATGLAPAAGFLPTNPASGLRGPSPTFGVAQTAAAIDMNGNRKVPSVSRVVGRLNLGPSSAERNLDNVYSNDASTVVSADLGVIEVGGNDDATVSTIGSFLAVQQMPTASFAPPGFCSDQMRDARSQWDTNGAMPSMNEMYGLSGSSFPHSGTGFNPSVGIPESGPLLDHHRGDHNMMRATSLNLPSRSNRILPTLGSFSAASTDFANGGSSLFGGAPPFVHSESSQQFMRSDSSQQFVRSDSSQQFARNDSTPQFVRNDSSQYTGMGIGSSLLPNAYSLSPPRAGILERASTAPTSNVSSYMTETPILPGLFGFASDLNPKPIDSTVIDSISTGNTAIDGPVLWGSSSGHVGGSSLLGNLINNSSGYHSETQHSLNEPASLFANHAFHSGGASWERDIANNVQGSNTEGGTGSNIW